MAAIKKPTLYEFSDSILSLLECPVCLKHMKPPISQCENSHCICSQCATQVLTCPSCRGDIITMRCLPLEHLSEKVLVKCEFVDYGCSERLLQNDMPTHIRVCPYRSYECLPGLPGGCNWKGKRSDIYAHVSQQHNHFKLTPREDGFISKALDGLDFDDNFNMSYIISYGGEAFWLHEMCRPDVGKLYIAVQYIGLPSIAGTFTYAVDLSNRKLRHLYQAVTHGDSESVDNLISTGNCASIPIPIIQSMVNEATFKYEIQIKACIT